MNSAAANSRLKSAANVLLIALFFLLLWLPTFDTFLHFDHASALNEKRRPAPLPQFQPGLDGLKHYIAGLEAFFNDHFGCRNQLIRWHNQLAEAMSSGRRDVLVGRDGWLYFDEYQMHMVENFQGILQFSPPELADLAKTQQDRRDWLAQRGIRYLYVIAPNKESIYPEYLPSWLKPIHPRTKLDQFVEYMRANSTVVVPDLRPALREAKTISPTYYQTDSHWNSFGGFVAAREILKNLPPDPSSSDDLSLHSFEFKKEKFSGGDLTILLGGLYAQEDNVVLAPKAGLPPLVTTLQHPEFVVPITFTSNALAQGSCLVFRDSFGPALMPFLGYHFKTVGYFWSPGGFDTNLIEKNKPDVVISEIVERHFDNPAR